MTIISEPESRHNMYHKIMEIIKNHTEHKVKCVKIYIDNDSFEFRINQAPSTSDQDLKKDFAASEMVNILDSLLGNVSAETDTNIRAALENWGKANITY